VNEMESAEHQAEAIFGGGRYVILLSGPEYLLILNVQINAACDPLLSHMAMNYLHIQVLPFHANMSLQMLDSQTPSDAHAPS